MKEDNNKPGHSQDYPINKQAVEFGAAFIEYMDNMKKTELKKWTKLTGFKDER